jgi:dynein heavy chain
MLVGPTCGGKTTNWKVLQDAMSSLKDEEMFEKVHVNVMNPKSITMDQLYGFSDA